MALYSVEPRIRKYVTGYEFLSFRRNTCNKYGKPLLDAATKTGLIDLKCPSKKSGSP